MWGKDLPLRTQTNVGGTVWNNFVNRIISYFNNSADALLEIQRIDLEKLFPEAGKKRRVTLITALEMGTWALMLCTFL